ncbi:MFS transporter [Methylobacterium oryzae]|uniref:MFS transporter n=1 Tax=Methylobacterium oryzae TaxID=334852 RepID=UPI002F353063
MALPALGCGLAAANIYYSQPLVEPIRASLDLPAESAGLIAMAPQIGYALGLVLLLPLCDLVENRRLAGALFCACALSAAMATLGGAGLFLGAALGLGLASVVVQVLLLIAVSTSSEGRRGQVVGTLTSALLVGVMLSRAFAGAVAEALGWRAVFLLAAAAMLALALLMVRTLPIRRPGAGDDYLSTVGAMGRLLVADPVLRRRSLHHASAFAAFSLFWTIVPLHLTDRFHMSQIGVAAFSLTGTASVVAAFLSGRVPDRDLRGPITAGALAAVVAALLFAGAPVPAFADSVAALTCSSLVLCIGLTIHAVLAQRDVLSSREDAHGRVNGAFMAAYFTGGALGSALGAWLYATGGWHFAALVGGLIPMPAFLHAAWRARSH